jgi:hypothetical protein
MSVTNLRQWPTVFDILIYDKDTTLLIYIYLFTTFTQGPGSLSLYTDLLRDGRSRDRIPVKARFPATVQTVGGAHPTSHTMGTGSFPGVKRREVVLSTHPHLEPRSRKAYSYTSTPRLGLRGLFYGELYL